MPEKRRLLWLKTELLHPIDKGGKIRTYHMAKGLKDRFHVTYLTLDDGQAAPDAHLRALEYCHVLERIPFAQPAKGTAAFFLDLLRNVASPLPYAIAKYRSEAMRDAIRRTVMEERIDLVVCDFIFPSLNVVDGLGVPTILFQHNVEAAIWARHSSISTSRAMRLYLREQWRRMRAFEGKECRRFDHVIAVSDADARAIRGDYDVANVSSVPTGVDVDYFRPTGEVPGEPTHVVFMGSMDWMPNEDGIRWFVEQVLPLLKREVPEVRLSIVGRNPTAGVRALAELYEGVQVTGTVPDVRPWLERAGVFVVPLRVGGGTRLKIFEAMAMERPIVSTTIGAEGLPVRDEEEIIIADDAAAFASAVARLIRDRPAAKQLGSAAAARVRAEFGWDAVAARFAAICESVVGARAPSPAPQARVAVTP